MALEEPWRGMAVRLLKTDVGERNALWHQLVDELPKDAREGLIEALGGLSGAAIPGSDSVDREQPPALRVVSEPGAGFQPESTEHLGQDARAVGGASEERVSISIESKERRREREERSLTTTSHACSEPSIISIPGMPAWPEPIGRAALHGLVGQVVEQIGPTTEADPTAVLMQFLLGFGSLIGRGAFVRVDGHAHHANLYVVIVGETARARKGTSWRRVYDVFDRCDPGWTKACLKGGLSSGEGLIAGVRDDVYGLDKKGGEVLQEQGVSDKRLLAVEGEFGGVLRILSREGSTLSSVLRQGYDGDDLRILTRNSPVTATAPHIALCGHVTQAELSKHLSSVEAFNGLGNRILWACARRSKTLPFGGSCQPGVMEGLGDYLRIVADQARLAGPIAWAPSGAKAWQSSYDDLTAAQPGLLGAITARAEAHTLRLAMIYALLDSSKEIAEEHVLAALAVWKYCNDSAAFLFGELSTDAKANAVVEALKQRPDGLSRAQIHYDVLNKHVSGQALTLVLDSLVSDGSIRRETIATKGRPAQLYFSV